MTLNCCRTRQALQRVESERQNCLEKVCVRNSCCKKKVDRNWSGSLVAPPPPPPPYEQIGKASSVMSPRAARKMFKKETRRLNSLKGTGQMGFDQTNEPRLVRSSGMRRDWSFEDLRARVRGHQGIC